MARIAELLQRKWRTPPGRDGRRSSEDELIVDPEAFTEAFGVALAELAAAARRRQSRKSRQRAEYRAQEYLTLRPALQVAMPAGSARNPRTQRVRVLDGVDWVLVLRSWLP